MTCTEYLIATARCANAHLQPVTIPCPVEPEHHLRTRIPDQILVCFDCKQPTRIQGYWQRTDTPLYVEEIA